MDQGLRKFLQGWIEQLLRSTPLSNSAPNLGALLAHKEKLERKLAKLHPDLSSGEAACVFIYESLHRQILMEAAAEAAVSEGKPLSIDDDRLKGLVERVVDYLDSLPRRTLILVPIGSIESVASGFYELPSGFCVLKTPEHGESDDVLPDPIRGLVEVRKEADFLPAYTPSIARGAYLGRITTGIPTFIVGRETFNRVLDDLRVWIGIGRRLYHFRDARYRGLLDLFGAPPIMSAYTIDLATAEMASRLISVEETNYLRGLTLSIKDSNVEAYATAFANVVEPFFSDKNLAAAAAAYQWLIDSLTAMNDTNAFLFSCYGLEAVLGEESTSDESLTTLLAERCAYLLGETNSERASLKALFKKLYRTRSKVVHGRERRITGIISTELFEARELLERAAFAEWSKVQKRKATDEVLARTRATSNERNS